MVKDLVKGELAWPETNCEACNYALREDTPKAAEKSNDEGGRLKWTDFCPRCGRGMFVGDRGLPTPTAEVLAEREAQAILKVKTEEVNPDFDPEHQVTPGEPFAGEASGVDPEKRGKQLAEETDHEDQLTKETEISPEGKQESSEEVAVMYWCTKCAGNHMFTSKKGKEHAEFTD